MSEVSENVLRDLLAGRLDLIGDDLMLLKTEQYLPNDLGTRGFSTYWRKIAVTAGC
jgi:hypothetical protein